MGTKERRERERQQVRQRIMDAARELFASEGYEAVSMRKIAEKIEYSPTAIYLHFKDKEELMRQLCATDFGALAREFQRIAKIADPIERLSAVGRAYAGFALANPNHYRLMFMTPAPVDLDKSDLVAKGDPEEDAYAFLRMTVAEAIKAGRIRSDLSDPDLVAQTVWAGTHGVVSLLIAKGKDPWTDWRPAERLLQLMSETLVRGLAREGR